MAVFTRQEILRRLHEQAAAGRAIVMFGAGTGLTARCAELGGADLIGIYSTAFYRMQGKPSLLAWLPYADVNAQLLRRAREILSVVRQTPCIAGLGAHDPDRSMDMLLHEVRRLGFSGVTNEPFASMYGPAFSTELDAAGIGFSREVDLIATAREQDMFSLAWVFTPDEARRMAEAGADVLGAMVGVTAGGLTGASKTVTLEEGAELVKGMCEAGRKARSDVLILAHGGPFKDPESAAYAITHSGADGYAAGSSGERVPTERAVIDTTEQYKQIRLTGDREEERS
jgi:predicted TIM-barrel enzyme